MMKDVLENKIPVDKAAEAWCTKANIKRQSI